MSTLSLVALALLDTVSVSTLAIPIWFLLTPQGLRIINVTGYLTLVGFGYFVLGLLLLSGLSVVRSPLTSALHSSAGNMALAIIGTVLILWGIWYGFRKRVSSNEGKLTRWREIAVGASATWRGVVTVAAMAVVLEVATMFPYLAAIDILSGSSHPWSVRISLLALYCSIMIAPALIATSLRALSKRLVRPTLQKIDYWLKDNAHENTAWLLGIGGFMLLSNTTVFNRGIELLEQM